MIVPNKIAMAILIIGMGSCNLGYAAGLTPEVCKAIKDKVNTEFTNNWQLLVNASIELSTVSQDVPGIGELQGTLSKAHAVTDDNPRLTFTSVSPKPKIGCYYKINTKGIHDIHPQKNHSGEVLLSTSQVPIR
ncbi:hypothetical protein BH10PSE19_BH10PSE19_14210 [soil metagenome]